MKSNKKCILSWFLGLIVLYGSCFLFSFLVNKDTNFHFGKDNGLVFLVCTKVVCSAAFFIIVSGWQLKSGITGMIVGFIMYLFYVLLCGDIVYQGILTDQLIVSTLVTFSAVVLLVLTKNLKLSNNGT